MGMPQMLGPEAKSGPATQDRAFAPPPKKKTLASASKPSEDGASNIDIAIALRVSTVGRTATDNKASADFTNGKLRGWLPPSALDFSARRTMIGRVKVGLVDGVQTQLAATRLKEPAKPAWRPPPQGSRGRPTKPVRGGKRSEFAAQKQNICTSSHGLRCVTWSGCTFFQRPLT